jgi:hypothetical protein
MSDVTLGEVAIGSESEQKLAAQPQSIKLSLASSPWIHGHVESYKISREKFEPEPGFEPRTSRFLARHQKWHPSQEGDLNVNFPRHKL